MKDNNKKQDFIELRAKGFTYKKISQKLKVHIRTLFFWAKEFENEINFLKSAERENYLASLNLDENYMFKLIADELKKIDSALKGRDYKTFPPKYLIKWKIELLDKLQKLPVLDEKTMQLYTKTIFYDNALRNESDEELNKLIEEEKSLEQNENNLEENLHN